MILFEVDGWRRVWYVMELTSDEWCDSSRRGGEDVTEGFVVVDVLSCFNIAESEGEWAEEGGMKMMTKKVQDSHIEAKGRWKGGIEN